MRKGQKSCKASCKLLQWVRLDIEPRLDVWQLYRMSSYPKIKFGTSGWRGLIARDFTFDNVRVAAQAVADYLTAERKDLASPLAALKPLVILGHDARFLGSDFALAVAEILEQNGYEPLLCEGPTPTPVIAFLIRAKKALGGINLTASHNPPEYQGFKFSTWNGAGAPAEITSRVEARIAELQQSGWEPKVKLPGQYTCATIDPHELYFAEIRKFIDFNVLAQSKIKVAVELMYGAGRGYLDTLLESAGVEIIRLHNESNPLFGGHRPEPNAEGMAQARELVLAGKATLGLGVDGDADRFGVVDTDGTFLVPNQILALALYHLVKNRGWTGSVVRTVPTSHLVDAVASIYGVKVHETPVGFKYIGALMESEPIIVGGEESGGLSVKGHVPEKDGVLATLLMAELVAKEGRSLGSILKEIQDKAGYYYSDRINIAVAPDKKAGLLSRLGAGVDRIGDFKVQSLNKMDGFKFLLDDGEWVAFRASGTEPVFRCYIEARTPAHLEALKTSCQALLD